MTVALLVPCYNAVRFLPRLRAQVDQLTPAFDEVLLADDCSQDATATEAEALGFKILRLPKNLGPGGARNALARATTAEWIHFHDVDDEIAPGYLEHVRPFVDLNTDAVIHHVDFIDEISRGLHIRWEVDPTRFADDPGKALLVGPMPTMSSFLRRKAFLRLGGFNEQHRCFEDGDFHFRLAAAGASIKLLPKVLEWSLRHGQGAGGNGLYCFQCRLAFLQSYAVTYGARFRDSISAEAERAAAALLREGDQGAAKQAVVLAMSLGRSVPTTNSRTLRFARWILPPLFLLRLQQWVRRSG